MLLEANWVLRRTYGFNKTQIAAALERLIALPQVECEDLAAVVEAMNRSREGMDCADALHLASARQAGRFASFDRRMIALARRISDVATTPV